jgi:hypothetical protein
MDAGAFSQPTQLLASRFSLANAATVTGASWFGSMYPSADPLNTGDTWAFDMIFRSNAGGTPGAVIATRSVTATVFETAFTLNDVLTPGAHVYRFDASFSGVALLGSTDYFFSAVNTGVQSTFRWNRGTVPDAAALSSDGGSTWSSTALGTRAPLAYQLSASTTVPEPSSVLLLASALPLVAHAVRRRRALTALAPR